jgi:hypothetical protein
MTVSGASAASSSLASQPLPSIAQHTRGRHPSISDVEMQGANPAGASGAASPSGKARHKVDITA